MSTKLVKVDSFVRAKDYALSRQPVQWVQETWRRWQEDDGSLMAAAVSFYVGLSFFPLLMVLISGLGWFLEQTNTGRDAEQQLLQVLSHHLSPTLSDHAAHALAQIRDQASIGGPVGFIALLFAAMAFFAHFERAFDRIWNVDDPESTSFLYAVRSIVTRRLLAFCMLVGLGATLVAIFVVGIAVDAFKSHSAALLPIPDWIVGLSQTGLTVGLNALIFTAIYRWLPKTIVSWKEAAYGGIAAAVTWEIGRQLLASWLIGNKYTSAYGVVGSFIAILLWSYYSVSVLLLGAEFIQTICRACSDTKIRR